MEKKDSYARFLGLRTSAYMEIIIFFLITTVIALLSGISYNFFSIPLHPFWIVVILISTQYGTSEGLLAAFISTVILLSGPLPVRNVLQDRFEYFFELAKLPILWFVSATILGEICMRHIRERKDLKKAIKEAEERENTIAESYESLKKIKERLEIRVASDMQTTLMMIDSFQEMEKSGKEGIIQGGIDLIKTLIAPEKFSIFLLEEGMLKQIASEGWEGKEPYAERIGPESLLFQEVIGLKKTVAIHTASPDVLGKEGVLAVPILESSTNHVLGMIKIEQIPFLRLRTANIESLSSIGKWIGTAYANFLKREHT